MIRENPTKAWQRSQKTAANQQTEGDFKAREECIVRKYIPAITERVMERGGVFLPLHLDREDGSEATPEDLLAEFRSELQKLNGPAAEELKIFQVRSTSL